MASGPPGRRSPFVPPLLLAGFLLLAPWKAFFLGPLALLLLLSRPRTLREWLWILVTAISAVALWRLPGSLSEQLVRAAALFFTGAFVAATLAGMRGAFPRALVAAGAMAVATIGWSAKFGIQWGDLRAAVISSLWLGWRMVFDELPDVPPVGAGIAGGSSGELAAQLAIGTRAMGDFFPALLVLTAILGGALAADWYHRVAASPIGSAPAWFRTFRFSDHLVWGLVLVGGVVLTGPTGAAAVVSHNLLLVLVGLYAARGMAVIRWITASMSMLYTVLLLVAVPFLLPLAMGCAVVGVADTWLDLRRRWPPPSGDVT